MRYLFIILFFIGCMALSSWTTVSSSNRGDDGKELYMTYCKSCHGKKGSLSIGGAAKLTKSLMSLDDRITMIAEGKGKMAPFGSILSKKEIKAVAKFTLTFSNE